MPWIPLQVLICLALASLVAADEQVERTLPGREIGDQQIRIDITRRMPGLTRPKNTTNYDRAVELYDGPQGNHFAPFKALRIQIEAQIRNSKALLASPFHS